jgi:hypothetical protein
VAVFPSDGQADGNEANCRSLLLAGPGASVFSVLCHEAQAKWHLGEIASSQTTVAEAISLAKDMNDMYGLAVALWHAAVFAYYQGKPAEVECFASKSIELSSRQNFETFTRSFIAF